MAYQPRRLYSRPAPGSGLVTCAACGVQLPNHRETMGAHGFRHVLAGEATREVPPGPVVRGHRYRAHPAATCAQAAAAPLLPGGAWTAPPPVQSAP